MSTHLLDLNDIQAISNDAIAIFAHALADDGLLTADADDILSQYAIVLHKKGSFGAFLTKLLWKDKENAEFNIRVVRLEWEGKNE